MSIKKMKTPLELLNDDIQEWIDKTEDLSKVSVLW